jgi:hypothetical protein
MRATVIRFFKISNNTPAALISSILQQIQKKNGLKQILTLYERISKEIWVPTTCFLKLFLF